MLADDELERGIGQAGLTELDRNIRFIASSVVRGGADFLAGAGMSRDANLPSGEAMAAALLRLAYPDLAKTSEEALVALAATHSFEAVVGAVEGYLPETRTSLLAELGKLLAPGGVEPNPGPSHQQFARLVGSGRGRIRRVFTTNFDKLFESVLGPDASITITESNSKAYEDAIHRNEIPVVHLHGTLESDTQISEADVADTSAYWSVNTIFLNRLFAAETFTFVGYSMSDPDLGRVYRTYRDQIRLRQKHEKWCYVVMPVDNADQYLLARDVWKTRGAFLVPVESSDFFERLVEAVNQVESEDTAKLLMAAYGWSNAELIERVQKISEALDLKEQADAHEVLLQLYRLSGDQS